MRLFSNGLTRIGSMGAVALGLVTVLAIPCVNALAAGTPATSYIVEITATADGHTGTFSDTFPAGPFTDQVYDLFPTPFTILSNDVDLVPIARIDNLSLEYLADAITTGVALNFAITGLDAANPLVLSVKSAVVDVDPVANAYLQAQAGLTITDGEGGAAGVSASGGFAGKAYQARYNGGSVFASLIDLPFSGPNNASSSGEHPGGGGFAPIGGALTSMEVEYQFTVSPRDQASGTSVFVTPEPVSIAILALGALCVRRRKVA